MKTLTFAFDVQLNDSEDWIAKDTEVQISENEIYLNRHSGYTPVIIKDAYDFDGNKMKISPYVEWFSNGSFVELRSE